MGKSNREVREEGRTAVLSARVSHKALAGIAVYMADNGRRIKTRSEILSLAVEYLYEDLIRTQRILPVATTEQALGILEVLGLGNTNRERRSLSWLRETIMKEITDIPKTVDPKMFLIGEVATKSLEVSMAKDIDILLGLRKQAQGERPEEGLIEKMKLKNLQASSCEGQNVPIGHIPDKVYMQPDGTEVPDGETIEEKAKRFEQEQAAEKNAMQDFLAGFIKKEE